jgi:methyl-accepting chemotaxis protein
MPVRTRILLGFGVLMVIGGAMGIYGLQTIRSLSSLANGMYEGPLIAGQFSQSAQARFLKLNQSVELYLKSDDPAVRAEHRDSIAALEEIILEDMATVAERTQSEDSEESIKEILALFEKWSAMKDAVLPASGTGSDTYTELFAELDEAFELLVEYSTEQAFLFRESAVESADRSLKLQLFAAAFAGVIAVIVLILLERAIAKPIRGMTDAMCRLAEGELEIEVPATDRKDEIGHMADAVKIFRDNAIEMKQMRENQAEIERRNAEEKHQMMQDLADGFEQSVGVVVSSVSSAAGQLQSTAQSMTSIVEGTENRAVTVQAAAEQASVNVQSVSGAAEKLSGSIRDISVQVNTGREIADNASSKVTETDQQISGLLETAEQIGEVVGLINEIAEQTNLLALNATIEAARAGESGKGFAVVASEVKNLANQTARATQEISTQIESVQNKTNDAVLAMGEISNVVGQVQEINQSIADAMDEQNIATGEIARNVDEASGGTQEVSRNIQSVTEIAGEGGEVSRSILDAANLLNENAVQLRSQVEQFLSKIRAGS